MKINNLSVTIISGCIVILSGLLLVGCGRQPDYRLKIKQYQGRDDLTMGEKQMLYQAELKQQTFEGKQEK